MGCLSKRARVWGPYVLLTGVWVIISLTWLAVNPSKDLDSDFRAEQCIRYGGKPTRLEHLFSPNRVVCSYPIRHPIDQEPNRNETGPLHCGPVLDRPGFDL